jgi:hypothetical protein
MGKRQAHQRRVADAALYALFNVAPGQKLQRLRANAQRSRDDGLCVRLRGGGGLLRLQLQLQTLGQVARPNARGFAMQQQAVRYGEVVQQFELLRLVFGAQRLGQRF